MKNYLLILFLTCFLIIGCQKTQIQLAKVGSSSLQEVDNYSSIYFNFDSIRHKLIVNDHNRISNTHWLFHVDKRLKMKWLLPKWKELLLKRQKSPHEEIANDWYFTAFDTIKKRPALINGSQLSFLETNHIKDALFLDKNGSAYCNDLIVTTANWFENIQIRHENGVILIDPALTFQQWMRHWTNLEVLLNKQQITIHVQLKMLPK